MSGSSRRHIVPSLLGILLAVQIVLSFVPSFCPIHCHNMGQKTVEPHLKLGMADCRCFFLSFCPPDFSCGPSCGEVFGPAFLPTEDRLLAVEAFEIFHPPLCL